MKLMKAGVSLLALLLAAPVWATTIWGGFEDSMGRSSDYDYNDLVFSISGANLALRTFTNDAVIFGTSGLTLGTSGTPFWNNASLDGSKENVGYCMFGGGNCNGGVALDPNGAYVATKTRGSVDDVYFSVSGNVSEEVVLHIASDTDTLGWERLGSSTIHYFSPNTEAATFNPGGDFVLVASNGDWAYRSDCETGDGLSHFAFFVTPEPATTGLLGLGLAGGALILRKRAKKR